MRVAFAAAWRPQRPAGEGPAHEEYNELPRLGAAARSARSCGPSGAVIRVVPAGLRAGLAATVLAAVLAAAAWRLRRSGAQPAALRSKSALWQDKTKEAPAQIGVVWVGCFVADSSGSLTWGPEDLALGTQACAQSCDGFTYMALQDGGTCSCGNSYAQDPQEQQVFDGDCGAVCDREDVLSPTRYCGTATNNAIYRLVEFSEAGTSTGAPAAKAAGGGGAAVEADEDLGDLVGPWVFGHESSKCFIDRTDTGELTFMVPLPHGQTAAGTLRPTRDGWLQAGLFANAGEDVGTIRLRAVRPRGTLVSNFKYPGDAVWGQNTVAHLDTTGRRGEPHNFQVVTSNGINVRDSPSEHATILGTKWEGDVVQGRSRGNWVELVGEPGFIMVTQKGHTLLRRRAEVAAGTATEPPTSPTTTTMRTTSSTTWTATLTVTSTFTTTTTFPENVLASWKVITPKGLNVRAAADNLAVVLSQKMSGATVRGKRHGTWIALADEPGFMMIKSGHQVFLEVAESRGPELDEDKPQLCENDCDKKPPSMECLQWEQDGCGAITDKGKCLASLDGRKVLKLGGKKIHGQPCVWCGGHECADTGHVCETFDRDSVDAVGPDYAHGSALEVATCSDPGRAGKAAERSMAVEAALGRAGLFCYALMMASGYEHALLKAQANQAVGIFDCDGYAVFSNVSASVGFWNKTGSEIRTVLVNGSLSVPLGGKWRTALNTGVFIRVWQALFAHGGFAQYDWTVKADPDCVFVPSRLRDVLKMSPMDSVPLYQQDPGQTCGECKLQGHEQIACPERVQNLERAGRTCEQALELSGRSPPLDCGCGCGSSSCFDGARLGAMYLVNCRFGLHGPIEVLSREAVQMFVQGVDECQSLRRHPWGEDKYLDHCLQRLGVRRVLEFQLLSETACGQEPVNCASSNVAFHPFKGIQSYFDCWGQAMYHGNWPGDALSTHE